MVEDKPKLRHKVTRTLKNFADNQAKGAQETLLEELFNDMYRKRGKIYKVNFFRGIAFGLGSVLGGTLVVAIILWILTLLIGFPVVGDLFEYLKDSIHPE